MAVATSPAAASCWSISARDRKPHSTTLDGRARATTPAVPGEIISSGPPTTASGATMPTTRSWARRPAEHGEDVARLHPVQRRRRLRRARPGRGEDAGDVAAHDPPGALGRHHRGRQRPAVAGRRLLHRAGRPAARPAARARRRSSSTPAPPACLAGGDGPIGDGVVELAGGVHGHDVGGDGGRHGRAVAATGTTGPLGAGCRSATRWHATAAAAIGPARRRRHRGHPRQRPVAFAAGHGCRTASAAWPSSRPCGTTASSPTPTASTAPATLGRAAPPPRRPRRPAPRPTTASGWPGRVLLIRRQGRLTFATIRDRDGEHPAVRLAEGRRRRRHGHCQRPRPRRLGRRRGHRHDDQQGRAVGQGRRGSSCWPRRCARCPTSGRACPTSTPATASATSTSS